ncbi:MAG: 50S ribosomal protein L6 [Chloroflexi bacterium]|nr:50S ribosomal protein L6 [Chloroflexota bacterium]
MSRIGRLPIPVPENVQVEIRGSHVRVKGPKGELAFTFPAAMKIIFDEKTRTLRVERPSDEKQHKAWHGTTRAVLNNMVVGVSKGFQKVLEVRGTGYRAEVKGKDLVLNVGYSHPVVISPPPGIEFEARRGPQGYLITVKGYDKVLVGQVAANIRKVRPPEPYKGKGIRYQGEVVRRKAGKAGR